MSTLDARRGATSEISVVREHALVILDPLAVREPNTIGQQAVALEFERLHGVFGKAVLFVLPSAPKVTLLFGVKGTSHGANAATHNAFTEAQAA